jgi:hypothetical protein
MAFFSSVFLFEWFVCKNGAFVKMVRLENRNEKIGSDSPEVREPVT